MSRRCLALCRLASYRDFEKVKQVRHLGHRVHVYRRLPHHVLEKLLQLLVDGSVDRMPGTEQHGIQVLILLQVLLVEGQLAIARVRLPEPPDRGETLGPKIGQDMLDPPEPVRSPLRCEDPRPWPRPGSGTRRNAA